MMFDVVFIGREKGCFPTRPGEVCRELIAVVVFERYANGFMRAIVVELIDTTVQAGAAAYRYFSGTAGVSI